MSKSKFGAVAASVIGLAALSAPSARATVILTFDDGDPGALASSITVAPGVNFSVNLKLTANAGEQVSGVNYDVIAVGPGSTHFKLANRSLTNPASSYPDQPFKTDAEVLAAQKVLTPDSTFNLGGSTVSGVTGNGTFQVASLTFQALPGTLAGVYSIMTEAPGNVQNPTNNLTIGYNGAGPSFPDFPFTSHAVYTVNVTPEPASVALVGLLGGGILMRRRRA
jgi:hypothetical protein